MLVLIAFHAFHLETLFDGTKQDTPLEDGSNSALHICHNAFLHWPTQRVRAAPPCST